LPVGWEYGKGCTRTFHLESIGLVGVVLVLASAIARRFLVANEEKTSGPPENLPDMLKHKEGHV
jgi:hypothetical protein